LSLQFSGSAGAAFSRPGLQLYPAWCGAAVNDGRKATGAAGASLRAAPHHATLAVAGRRQMSRATSRKCLSLILSPVSLFCPGSAHGRHLMGSDKDRPANLVRARWALRLRSPSCGL